MEPIRLKLSSSAKFPKIGAEGRILTRFFGKDLELPGQYRVIDIDGDWIEFEFIDGSASDIGEFNYEHE